MAEHRECMIKWRATSKAFKRSFSFNSTLSIQIVNGDEHEAVK
jgi:hypothetical protein